MAADVLDGHAGDARLLNLMRLEAKVSQDKVQEKVKDKAQEKARNLRNSEDKGWLGFQWPKITYPRSGEQVWGNFELQRK